MQPVADPAGSTAPRRATLSQVEAIARRAGEIALAHFRSLADVPVERKGHLDLVTRADRDVEDFLVASLREAFPEDGFFGEEGGDIAGVSGRVWVIDPIDGTFNFVRGSRNWAISIGLFEKGRPVLGVIHAPARELTLSGGEAAETRLNGEPLPAPPAFEPAQASIGIGLHPSIATRDRLEVLRFLSDELHCTIRCCGASTLSLIEVALGETDGYVALGDASWDVMAALPILGNLGLSHTIEWQGADLRAKLRFACGREGFLAGIRPLLARVGGVAHD